MQLRQYQIDAVRDLYAKMTSGKKNLLLVAPTGSGKTAMASYVIRDAALKRARKVIFMAHRGELLDQTSGSLDKWGVSHGLISEGYATDRDSSVQVASIQSLDANRTLMPRMGPGDLIVVDECHRADAKKIVAMYPQCRVLGLTATPYRLTASGRHKALSGYDDFVVAATPRALESQGFITPIRIFAPPMPPSAYSTDMKEREVVAAQRSVMGDAVSTWLKRGRASTIVYCQTVGHSQAVCELFQMAGVKAVHVSGYEDLSKRRSLISKFRAGEIDVITNSMLLTEGLDVPHVSRIVMLRPTDSIPVYLQQVGRGVRPSPGKTHCELFDHAGNVLVHGHPYEERTVTLSGNCGNTVDENARVAGIWRCEKCFCVAPSAPEACPQCGEPPPSSKRMIRVVGGELQEYSPEDEKRLAEAARNAAEARAKNNERIKKMFGVMYSMGYGQVEARRRVMIEMSKFNAGRKPWEEFLAEARERARRTTTQQ